MSVILNKVVRFLLLAATGMAMLLYLLGILANVFGWLEMRRSDETLLELLRESAGDRAFVTRVGYRGAAISYAGISRKEGRDSVAVFFVHGSPGSLDAFTDYLIDSQLQAVATLITYDRFGYGNSQPEPSDLSLIRQSEQLFALTSYFDKKHNIFVGHSLGCSIIARLAMDHPEVVDGLVMVSAPIDPALEPSSWWRPLLDFPMVSIAMPHSFRISNKELAPLKKDLEDCKPLWEKVHGPVTFIHGDIDNLVPVGNVEFGKRVLTNSQNVSEVILEGKGHFILWTEEELIVEEIQKLIRG